MKKLRIPVAFIDAFDEYPQVEIVNNELILAGHTVGVTWDVSYIPVGYYIECGYGNFICVFTLTENNGIVTSLEGLLGNEKTFNTLAEMFEFVKQIPSVGGKEIQVYLTKFNEY